MNTMPHGRSPGRWWASIAFVLGVAVSVAANIAHTWHPAAGTLRTYAVLHHGSTEGWRPPVGAQIAAAFYPCALLLTVELLTRVKWPSGAAWAAARFGGTGVVAVVAAVVSYRHMAGLLAAYGEDALTARIGPLAVDGLMVVASFALLSLSRGSAPAPGSTGVLPLSPPVLPLTVNESTESTPAALEDAPVPCDIESAWSAMPTDPFPQVPDSLADWLDGVDGEGTSRSGAPGKYAGHGAAPALGSTGGSTRSAPESTLERTREHPGSIGGSSEEHVISQAREHFAQVLSAGGVPSQRTIKRELRVGWPRARRIHSALCESA